MGRTSKNIKLRIPEKPRKIKGFRSGSYRVATTISSRARYDHFDTSPFLRLSYRRLIILPYAALKHKAFFIFHPDFYFTKKASGR